MFCAAPAEMPLRAGDPDLPPEISGHDRGTPIDGNPPQLYPQSMIDRERFRSLLEDERAQAAALVSSLRSDIASAEASRRGLRVDEQDPEGASTIFEISKETSLLDLQLDHLDEIDAALDRIDEGSYGTCLECGQPIPEGRLEARPWTGYCIDHAVRHRPPPTRTRPVA